MRPPVGRQAPDGGVTQFNTLERACPVEEDLYFQGRFFGMPRHRAGAARLLERVGIHDRADAMAAELSGGLAGRTQLACALMRHPEVLFLDQPTTGLDPQSRMASGGRR